MAWFCRECDRLTAQGKDSAKRRPDHCKWCGSGRVYERRRSPDKRVKLDVLASGACASCGSSTRLTVDHIVPLSRGGTNARSNLQALCEPCHDIKTDRADENASPSPSERYAAFSRDNERWNQKIDEALAELDNLVPQTVPQTGQ